MSENKADHNHDLGNSEFEHPSFWFAIEDKLKTLFGSYLCFSIEPAILPLFYLFVYMAIIYTMAPAINSGNVPS